MVKSNALLSVATHIGAETGHEYLTNRIPRCHLAYMREAGALAQIVLMRTAQEYIGSVSTLCRLGNSGEDGEESEWFSIPVLPC